MSSVAIAETYPLSGMQHAMLAHTLLAPGTGVDILQLELTLREPLDTARLREALQRVVARHAALRSAFRWKGLEEPRQEVWPAVELDLAEHALGDLDEGEAARRIEAAIEADRMRGFDAAQAPLHRVTLFHLGPREHRLLWTFHHALVDGRSLRVVLHELFAIHDAILQGNEPVLAPVRPYRDYLAWLGEQPAERSRAFWRAQLEGFAAPTPIPLGRAATKAPAPAGFGARELELSREETRALQAICAAEKLTLGTAVQAAWALVLSTFSGEAEVLFGTTRACRRTALGGEGTATMVGLMFNTLPLRVRVDRGALLFPWLRGLRAAGRAIGEHEHTPPLDVKQWSDVSSGAPLFETLVAFEDKLLEDLLAPRGASRRYRNGPSFALMLSAYGGEALALRLTYERARHEAAHADRLLGHVAELLRSLARATAETRVGGLSLLNEAERRTLLTGGNEIAAVYPREQGAHALFEAQVGRTPDAPALRFEGASLSYRALDERANQLARRLVGAGVGPETAVGLYVERSLDLGIAPLAVMKAGGCYLPLDPDYPPARLRWMLADSGAKVIVASGPLPADLALPGAAILRLDLEREALAAEDPRPLPLAPGGERLAYLLYTSGSTGKPKGVEIPHRALVNFLCAMRGAPGLSSTDRLLAVTSLSFDIAGLELFLPLIVGAEVEVASRALAADGAALGERLTRSGITVIQATPSTFRLLLDAGWQGAEGFKILVGGEAVPPELVAQLLPRAGSVWNMYGPTETTIWSTIHRFAPGGGPVSVGRPIANTRVLVLDEGRDLLPLGAAGQVYIGGEGLARGYRGRPDLTADRFVPDPFVPGERLYATGDLGRWSDEGELMILGRIDAQVKVRGHRIELGEIEAALTEHPRVSHAVATAEETRLVAHLVPRDPASPPSGGELRLHLQQRLPAYMIPAAFVVIPALPLLPNGKVDRRALPAPEAEGHAEGDGFSGPRNALEADLVAMWESVLGQRPIGTRDDFFELGGHSLLAARLFDRLESRTGRRLPLSTLLSAPTVERLAALLAQEGWSPSWSSLVAIRAEGSKPPFFCVHAIGGNVLNYRQLSLHLGPDQPLYGLQARGLDGRPAPAATVEEMATSYVEEIRSVQPHGPYRLGGASSGGVVAFEMAQQLRRSGEEVALLVLMDTVLAGLRPEVMTTRPRAYALDQHLGQLLTLPRRAGASYLAGRARARVGIWRDALDRTLGRRPRREPTPFEQITARDRAAMRAYLPVPYEGPITLILARDEPHRTGHDLRLQWADFTTGGLTVHLVPGTHAAILDEPTVGAVARYLVTCLGRQG